MKQTIFVLIIGAAMLFLPMLATQPSDEANIAAQVAESERGLAKAQADVKAARSLAAIATAQRQQVNAVATRQAVATVQTLASERQAVVSVATIAALNAGIAQSEATRQAAEVSTAQNIGAALRDEQLANTTSNVAKSNARLYGWLLPALIVLGVSILAAVAVAAFNGLASMRVERERFLETSGGVLDTTSATFVTLRELSAWGVPTDERIIDATPTPSNEFVLNANGQSSIVLKELPTDRARALRLIRDAIQTSGATSNAIPSWRALVKRDRKWNADSWSKAVAFLKPYGLNAGSKGTTSNKPLSLLYAEVGSPSLVSRSDLSTLPVANRTVHSEQHSEQANAAAA